MLPEMRDHGSTFSPSTNSVRPETVCVFATLVFDANWFMKKILRRNLCVEVLELFNLSGKLANAARVTKRNLPLQLIAIWFPSLRQHPMSHFSGKVDTKSGVPHFCSNCSNVGKFWYSTSSIWWFCQCFDEFVFSFCCWNRKDCVVIFALLMICFVIGYQLSNHNKASISI